MRILILLEMQALLTFSHSLMAGSKAIMTTKISSGDWPVETASSLQKSPFFLMGVVHRHFKNDAQRLLMSEYDITTEMLKALEVVNSLGPLSQQKLADSLMNERSATKRLVDNLIKRELIIATKDENNQKHKLLALSKEGRSVQLSGSKILIQAEKKWLSGLNEDEIKSLSILCKKLAINNIT